MTSITRRRTGLAGRLGNLSKIALSGGLPLSLASAIAVTGHVGETKRGTGRAGGAGGAIFRGRSFAAVIFTGVITAGLTVYGSGQAASAATQNRPPHAVVAHRAPTAPSCFHIANLAGRSGIYSACASLNGTYLRVTNTSLFDVLDLQVPQGELLPFMTVGPPNTGSELLNLAEEQEMPRPNCCLYVLVRPGRRLPLRR